MTCTTTVTCAGRRGGHQHEEKDEGETAALSSTTHLADFDIVDGVVVVRVQLLDAEDLLYCHGPQKLLCLFLCVIDEQCSSQRCMAYRTRSPLPGLMTEIHTCRWWW